jgi:hypothetical protein
MPQSNLPDMPTFVQGHTVTSPGAEGGGGAYDIVMSRTPQLPSRLKSTNAGASSTASTSEMRSSRLSRAVYNSAIRCVTIPSNLNATF